MHDPVRFGFIGFGRMAKDYHYPSLHKNPRARIAAVADTRPRILDAVLIASRSWMGDRQMDALVQALLGQSREGEPSPLAGGLDGRRAMEVVLGTYAFSERAGKGYEK